MAERPVAHRAALSEAEYRTFTGFDGDWRDTWWNDAFLSNMGRQWQLHEVKSILDVGCGVGHWGQRLMGHCKPDTHLYGIDAEMAWMKTAAERSAKLGLGDRSTFVVGAAESLPWPDNHFDMVTCQTVLIHVARIEVVIEEMLRVLKPGGLFLSAEPNNFGSLAASHIRDPLQPWSEIVGLLELEYYCTAGKQSVGEGHQSAGQVIAQGLHTVGCTEILVRLNDQTAHLAPPYTQSGAQQQIEQLRRCYDSGAAPVLGSTKENARRYFLAGGGIVQRFEELWTLARGQLARTLAAIDDGTHISAGGHLHYLTSGRKPR